MIKRIFVPLLAALAFAGSFGTLAGCSTMDGLGQDIQHGGKAISSEAREHKN
ncbi:MAG: entericidin A/B family lipoprotein [Burkholderiales bacterium]